VLGYPGELRLAPRRTAKVVREGPQNQARFIERPQNSRAGIIHAACFYNRELAHSRTATRAKALNSYTGAFSRV
jgi:hypothetical protein